MIRRRRPLWFAIGALFVFVGVLALFTETVHEPSTSGTGPTETLHSHGRHSGKVLIIGDSLALGADKAGLSRTLMADGWQVEVDAEVGRSTRTGVVVVGQRESVPPLVVVELGTNPSSAIGAFAAEVAQMIDELTSRGAARIVWVTPHHRDDNRYDDKGQAIVDAAAADSRLVVADWHAYAAGHRDWMLSDGLHYTDRGYVLLAAFIADAVDLNAVD